jgi:hypothetical protein
MVLVARKVWEHPEMPVFIAGNLLIFFASVFATGALTRVLPFRYLVVVLVMIWSLAIGLGVG